jgi:argininosuccinate lyase
MSKKLWGGRFTKPTDPLVEKFTRSIQYDYRLAEWDLLGSMIHVEILRRAKMLTISEAASLYGGLRSLYLSLKKGAFVPDPESEDIHTDIQNKLEKKVGDVALKLHTARSRNDQVVFATKLYCKIKLLELSELAAGLSTALCGLAGKNKDVIMAGYTHMQHAQPVYLKDHILAYDEMLKRDIKKLKFVFDSIRLTMGSGAIAGTPIKASLYSINVSKYLKSGVLKGFNIEPPVNSVDTVSDRDFVIETLGCAAGIGTHLSRLAQDLLLWSTKEFGFADIDEAYCTGSSLMPHKKNADALEMIRGYAARLYGNRISMLAMMKGLPLSYNRDMQLDKEPLFSSVEIVCGELAIMTGIVKTLKFNREKIAAQLEDEALYATDLVYYLVGKNVPFKKAHTIVGNLVRDSLGMPGGIRGMSDKELKKYSNEFVKKEVTGLFDPKISVGSKKSVKR